MTELQKVEFELLKKFVEICEKLNLTYFLVCGTALGSVKYHGFIPWDDDIDVALPREDYKIFCEKAQELLPEYYFVQTYFTDPKYPNFYCKLRDSRTTYIEKSVQNLNMNHGVYIDIFPLDGYPDDNEEANSLEKKKRLLKLQLISAFTINKDQKFVTRIFLILERMIGLHKRSNVIAQKIETLISKWSTEDSELWCNHGNWQGKLEYAPCAQYGKGTWGTFEGLNVRIPEQYDEYLTQKYGDWRADIPEEKKVGHHFYKICDLEHPYTYYIN